MSGGGVTQRSTAIARLRRSDAGKRLHPSHATMNSLLSLLPGKSPTEAAHGPAPSSKQDSFVTCSDGCKSVGSLGRAQGGERPVAAAAAAAAVTLALQRSLPLCPTLQAGVAKVWQAWRPCGSAHTRLERQPVRTVCGTGRKRAGRCSGRASWRCMPPPHPDRNQCCAAHVAACPSFPDPCRHYWDLTAPYLASHGCCVCAGQGAACAGNIRSAAACCSVAGGRAASGSHHSPRLPDQQTAVLTLKVQTQ